MGAKVIHQYFGGNNSIIQFIVKLPVIDQCAECTLRTINFCNDRFQLRNSSSERIQRVLNFDISSLASASFNGIPVINNQAIEQTVRLRENETSVLAGILQSQLGNAIDGTPGIANIPVIGGVLGDENVQNQDDELLIFITPRMLSVTPRADRLIYAGQGAPEGFAATGPTRDIREGGLPPRAEPPATPPPQAEPPEGEPAPQVPTPTPPQQQPQPAQPQPQPQGQPQNQPQPQIQQ